MSHKETAFTATSCVGQTARGKVHRLQAALSVLLLFDAIDTDALPYLLILCYVNFAPQTMTNNASL